MKVFENLNLQNNQLTNFTFEKLNLAPIPAKEGRGYYDTSDKHLKLFDGTDWKSLAYSTEEYLPIYNHNEINFSGHDSQYSDIYIGFRDEESPITSYKFCDGQEEGALADVHCKNIYANNLPHLYSYNLQCESNGISFNVFFYADSQNYRVEDLLTLYNCTKENGIYYPCNGVGLSPFCVIVGLTMSAGAIEVKYVEYDGTAATEKTSALSRYVKKVIQIF